MPHDQLFIENRTTTQQTAPLQLAILPLKKYETNRQNLWTRIHKDTVERYQITIRVFI